MALELFLSVYYKLPKCTDFVHNLDSHNKKQSPIKENSPDPIFIQTPASKIGFHCLNSILGNELGHDKCNRKYCECLCHHSMNSTKFGRTWNPLFDGTVLIS